MGKTQGVLCDNGAVLVARMAEAAGSGDPEQPRRSAHTLKSNAASFGATELSERCGALKVRARAGDIADADSAVTRIARAFVAVSPGSAPGRI